MKGKLKREINLFGALATVMGTVIGAGSSLKPLLLLQARSLQV